MGNQKFERSRQGFREDPSKKHRPDKSKVDKKLDQVKAYGKLRKPVTLKQRFKNIMERLGFR